MKDQAVALASRHEDPAARLNVLREYVQAFVLRSLHESEAANSIAFVGGTALRFLEDLPRYSEDLDYSLFSRAHYRPRQWFEKIKRDLTAAGFEATVTWNDRRTVQTGWIRIASILKDTGLTEHGAKSLSVKVEIDTNPPDGGVLLRTILTRHLTFVVSHYDLPSLMAGKLHALIVRSYPKGRDWYDLIWYRSHRPPVTPNLTLLQNALDQTEGIGGYRADQWPTILRNKLATIDTRRLIDDVQSFLERPEDRGLLERENLLAVL